jgi:hypothetical protein
MRHENPGPRLGQAKSKIIRVNPSDIWISNNNADINKRRMLITYNMTRAINDAASNVNTYVH